MSSSNLSKILTERGLGAVCSFDYKPPKSLLEAGENISCMAQGEAAKDPYTRSCQRKKNEVDTHGMAFGYGDSARTMAKSYNAYSSQGTTTVSNGKIRQYTDIDGSTMARSQKVSTQDPSLQIKSRVQRQVPRGRQQKSTEYRIDEMYLKSKASNNGSTFASSEFPPAHEQYTSIGKDLSLEYMKRPKISEAMCDIEIRVEDYAFLAHREALSCFSSYFSNLFSKGAGKYQLPMIVTVSGISKTAFQVFLNYVYDRVLCINYDNVEEVIAMADGFGTPFLKKQCLKLLDEISLETAVRMLRGKRHSQGSRLFKFLVSRVSEKFPQLFNNKGFLELDASTVCWILSNDDLHVSKEMDVFVLAFKWITHSLNKRQKYLSEVMRCVRYLCMTQEELFECLEISDMLKKSVEVRKIILRANWVLTARKLKRGDPLEIPRLAARNCLTEGRRQINKKTSAFFSAQAEQDLCVNIEQCPPSEQFTDQFQGRQTSTTRQYSDANGNFQRRECSVNNQVEQNIGSLEYLRTRYTTLPEPRSHEADAVLDNKMFFFGGSVPKLADGVAVATNLAYVFSYETKTWKQIKSMNTPRCHHATCKLDGMLYVIGGEDDKARVLSSVECYNPKTDAWFFVKSMLDPRLGASAAELDGKIIVTGGYCQSRLMPYITRDPILSSVESYDPKLNRWRPMNDLRFPRCYGNLVNVQGKLYLCGGATSFFGTTVLTSVPSIDVYNKNQGVWEEKTNLKEARHQAGCKVAGGRIYIFGGVSTEADINLKVECYDVHKQAWLNCNNGVHFPGGMFS